MGKIPVSYLMSKHFLSFIIAFVLSISVIGGAMWRVLGPVGTTTDVVFVVPQQADDFDVPHELYVQKLVRNETAFYWFYTLFGSGKSVVPGGYRLNGTMTAWQMVKILTGAPQLVWVHIREGIRKEQIGELLGTTLGWTMEQEKEWNAYKNDDPEYREGVYFPDTYLLPSDEPVSAVAERFITHFNEKMSPYVDKFTAKNIKWTTAIKIASLIERESGGDSDKALIAGIIWKRLDVDMKLEIDATLQYVKGNSVDGWWGKVVPADKYRDSPYNTYMHKGLPPGPISNPGLKAIEAVLNPAETDCIFYLHSSDREIHCAETYAEHLKNIDTYLR